MQRPLLVDHTAIDHPAIDGAAPFAPSPPPPARSPRPVPRSPADRPIETTVLIESARSTRAGFDDFYRRHRPSIGRALALAIGDVDLAAEATDEAFARAYERWAKVQDLERPEGWVYRVGCNWATSVLRRRRNHQRLYVAEPVEAPVITDPAVHAGIAALDVDHRAVVVCRHLLGWSVAETAAALRIREGTVKSRLHRANRQLQARLRHLDPASTIDL